MLDFRANTFLTVCETMNFTEAAKRLNITQPAVSQHIRFLENEYNTQLFLYHNKQLYITQTGKILKKRLMTMRNDQLSILEEMKSVSGDIELLSIGVTMTIGEYAVVDRIADFMNHHPDEGKINLALVEGNYPKDSYGHMNYSTEDYIGVCKVSHTFLKKNTKTMNDLKNERLIVRESGSGTRNILEELLLARGMEISDFERCIEVENMHTIIGLLKRDCGISFMYKIAVADELESGVLKEIKLSDFKMQHDFDFIWEKDSIYTDKYIKICKELSISK